MEPSWVPTAMFLATVGLVAVSVLTAGVSYFLFRSRVDPHVIVFTRHNEDQPTLLQIVIENIGSGPAFGVRFKSSRPIPAKAWGLSVEEAEEPSGPMSVGPLASGIPMLAPGEQRILGWGQYGGLIKAIGDGTIEVTAHYTSRKSTPWDPTDHSSTSLLEVKSFEMTSATESPASREARATEKLADHAGTALRHVQTIADTAAKVAKELDARRERESIPSQDDVPMLPSGAVLDGADVENGEGAETAEG